MIIKEKTMEKERRAYREALSHIIQMVHVEKFTPEERLKHIEEFAGIALEKMRNLGFLTEQNE